MEIRLYLDEDSTNAAVIGALRAAGIDVLTALEAGMIERSDEAHLSYASEQGRALCTYNVSDFNRLHRDRLRAGKHHGGLVLVAEQRYGPGDQARRLIALVAGLTAEAMVNRAEFLSSWEQP